MKLPETISMLSAHAIVVTALACGGPAANRPEQPQPAMAATQPVDQPPENGRLDLSVRPTRYSLTLAVVPSRPVFSGVAEIDLDLPRPQVAIYLHGRGLEVESVRVQTSENTGVDGTWTLVDEEQGLARVATEQPVGPGHIRLRLAYSAPFDPSLSGLYRVESGGESYAFTQMEPIAARKAFPCFDEPAFKTPFDVTLVVQGQHKAIANAPEVGRETMPNGMTRVRFATTRPLPTYLVAFAVGPFDVVDGPSIAARGVERPAVPLRGIAVKGQGDRLAFALEHTPALLQTLEAYFAVAYPYEKLDIIAVPDFRAGAMENAGAITFRDVLLLLPPDASTGIKRAFAGVMAHELAHQWFGNLVTMQWWDDLWLNEAFATWITDPIVKRAHPELASELGRIRGTQRALATDSLAATRQIRQPIESHHDIFNAFDEITYQKGQAVLSMFEAWLTPEVFQAGVRRYTEAHAHGNATARDLFAALSEAAQRDVSGPFESYLTQPGVPLVRFEPVCADGRATLRLSQERYRPLGSRAPADQTWQIPICVHYSRDNAESSRACTLLADREGTMELDACPRWIMPNAEGAGYYRWGLSPAWLDKLQAAFDTLSKSEVMSYADSVKAALGNGQLAFDDGMRALSPLARSTVRAVAEAPIGLLTLAIERLADDEQARRRMQRHASRLYRPQVRRLGWERKEGEDGEASLLRASILNFLALTAEDRGIRREAKRRGLALVGFGGDGAFHGEAADPDLRSMVLSVAVQEGGADYFDHVLAQLSRTSDPSRRASIVQSLAGAEGDLRTRALSLSLDERLRLNESLRPVISQIRRAKDSKHAWQWLREHYDAVAERVGTAYSGYLPMVATGFCDAESIEEIRAFFEPRIASMRGGPRNLQKALEVAELCAAQVDAHREAAKGFFARR